VGRRLPHLLAILSVLAALVATGCGGDRSNLIPSQRAQELTDQLDALQAQIDAGKCDGLASRIDTFHDDATSLRKPIDTRLRKRINEGVTSLRQHALTTCRNAAAKIAAEQADQTQTDTTPPDTTTTDTTTTETTPTTSTPTTSTPTDTAPATTVTPPDTGGGTGAPSDTTPGDTGDGSGDGSGGNGGTGDNGGVTP
jgi:hypothetical protein